MPIDCAANVGGRDGALAGALGGVREGAAAGADGGAARAAADANAGHGAVLLGMANNCDEMLAHTGVAKESSCFVRQTRGGNSLVTMERVHWTAQEIANGNASRCAQKTVA